MLTTAKPKRRGPKPAPELSNPDHPYTMKLADGRVVYVEIPGRWVTADRDGRPALTPDGVDFLDRVRALAVKLERPPAPAFITALREALGMTQEEFGKRCDVDKLTVSRWERGALRPNRTSLASIEKLRNEAVRRGVTLPT